MKAKKIPTRMCIACREMKEKKSLIRIVKQQDGKIFFDANGKLAGRGAYICKDLECIEKLKKRYLLNKIWKMEISQQLYQQLEEEFIAHYKKENEFI